MGVYEIVVAELLGTEPICRSCNLFSTTGDEETFGSSVGADLTETGAESC
jgi:hypothetical protein